MTAIVALGLFGLLGVTVGGCAGSDRTPRSAQVGASSSTLSLQGDWDDLDAAVEVGAGQAECVVVKMTALSPLRREYILRTPLSLNGTLVAERAEGQSAGPGPATITLRCSIGPFGNAQRETRVLDRVSVRLRDLRGVEFAPIRE